MVSLGPLQLSRKLEPRDFHDSRDQISRLNLILNEKKNLLARLVTTLSNMRREGQTNSSGVLDEGSVLEEISYLINRNAFLRRQIKIAEEKERKLASDEHVLKLKNELSIVRNQFNKVREDIATLEILRRRRKPKVREIHSEVKRSHRLRVEQRGYANEARMQIKKLTEELRRITKEDIKANERYISLRQQYTSGITVKDLETLKDEIRQQNVVIEKLEREKNRYKLSKELEREEKHKIIIKEQQECKLLESQVIDLQKQLLDKDIELQRSYQFTLK